MRPHRYELTLTDEELKVAREYQYKIKANTVQQAIRAILMKEAKNVETSSN